MLKLPFRVRIATFHTITIKTSAPTRNIRTTNFLSAKASPTPPSTSLNTNEMSSPIDLTQYSGDEDSAMDEDLKLAIAMSLSQPTNRNGITDPETSPKPPIPDKSATLAKPTGTGLLGMDRKQMEADRLARQAGLKRKRGEDNTSTSVSASISPPPLSRRTRTKSPPGPSQVQISPAKPPKASTQPSPPSSKSTLQYPSSTIKRTWILSSSPRTDRDITFSELIDAPNLKSALLSSFVWDFDWLFPQFRTKETGFVLVSHASSPQHAALLNSDFATIPNIRLIIPPTPPIGNMHSKLLLLFYGTHLRIAVPTANLTSSDWGECGRIENMVWIMDLPLRGQMKEGKGVGDKMENENSKCPFHTSLIQFLSAQNIPADVLHRVSTFDFSATLTNNIRFVHSIAGTHTHTDAAIRNNTGRCGLGAAVRGMGLLPKREEGESVQMDYLCSSVGSLTAGFLGGLWEAVCGVEADEEGIKREKETTLMGSKANAKEVEVKVKGGGIKSFFEPAGRVRSNGIETGDAVMNIDRKTKNTTPNTVEQSGSDTKPTWSSNLRIYFPSTHTIATSLGGPNAAGTICFQRRWWEGSQFPRSVLRDSVATRRGALMHSKILFARFLGRERRDREQGGWVYIGSANCSEAAWGGLSANAGGSRGKGKGKSKVKEGEGGDGMKLTCRNWECGVVMPVPVHGGKTTGLDIFDSVLPLPMVYPGRSYEENSDLEPWFFGEEA